MTLPRSVQAVNLGLSTFADALRDQGASVVEVDWRPPPADLVDVLTRLWGDRVDAANAEVVERIEGAAPCAVTVAPAREVVPGLRDGLLLHSGPPIAWERVCDPQRRALLAAAVFEGWASDRDDAARRLAAGEISLAPGNEHDHVGPMTGVCSPSMPVWVVEGDGARAFSTLNEGPGRTLWFGVGDDEAVERLRFFRDELGPTLARLLDHRGPVDVFALAAQGLNMGDELHMRSQATGNLLIRDLAPAFAAVGGESAARFVAGNHHFFLNLTMAACKCAWLACGPVEGSSVVSAMARNGTEMGLQLAGLPGRWFTAPAAPVQDQLLREGHDSERRGARHRRLGGHRMHRPRRHGAGRRARRGRLLRRRRRRRGRAHRADGADLRRPLRPLHDHRARLRGHRRGDRRAAGRRARDHAPDHDRRAARQRGQRPDRRRRCAPAARAVPRRRARARRNSVGMNDVGPNFIARPYRGVSVQDAPGLDEGALREWLIGRRVYRRTEFVVARRDGEHAVVQVEHPVGDDIVAPVGDLRVLARPDEVAFVVDPAVDTGNASQMARVARAGARVTVVQGRFEHVNFIVEPAPVRVRVLEVVPPEPPKLLEMARSVLDYDEDLPPVELDFVPIDLRALGGSPPFMYPCRCSGLEGEFLDAGPPELGDWTLVGCERSRQIHVALYGAEPTARVDFCPRVVGSADGPTLMKCCLYERGVRREGATLVVPWGAALDEVRDALRELCR